MACVVLDQNCEDGGNGYEGYLCLKGSSAIRKGNDEGEKLGKRGGKMERDGWVNLMALFGYFAGWI
jgi:hypothetical protein